jgi:hypothetical protein
VKRFLALALGLALAVATPIAFAAWLSSGSGAALVTATSVNQGHPPVATRGSGLVTLAWTASTLASGAPVSGYTVLRHDGATTTTACTTTSPTLTCNDLAPIGKTVTYGVVPTVGAHWTGQESTTTSFTYDNVAPNATASVSPLANGVGWNKTAVTVTLTATDPAISSGVDHITYTIDSGSPVNAAGASTSFAVSATGTHTVTFFAVDGAGNTESTNSIIVKIDPDAPLITNLKPVSGASGSWATINCSSGNRLCADVTDATSGMTTGTVTVSLTGTSGTNAGKCWNGSSFAAPPCTQRPMSVVSGSQYGSATSLTAALMGAGNYTMVVTATDAAGNVNTASSTFTVKTDQTISFTSTAPTNATVAGPTYTVAATATSGLAVAFSSATASVCTVGGTTVSFVGTGTCTINADQAGDASYDAAPQVQQSFAVKANQTISFTSTAPSGATVGGATYTVSATATSGLTVAFSSATTSVCTASGSTVTFVGAGTCTINANQAGNASFNPAPQVQQSFAVAKGNQTITFTSTAPSGATVGGATYTVSATASSGLTVAFSSATTSVCTASGSTVTFVGAGTCTINANQAGNASFNAAPQVQQSFTVAGTDTVAPSLTNIMNSRSPLTWSNNNLGNNSWNQDACAGNQVCATTTDSGTPTSGIKSSAIYFTLTGTSLVNNNKCWNGTTFVNVAGSGTACQVAMAYNSGTGRITATLDQSNMLDGTYTLKLHVEDIAGNVTEQTVTLTIT